MGGKRSPAAGGNVWITLSRLSLLLIILMMAAIGFLICRNSFFALWPGGVERVALADGGVFLGFPVNGDTAPDGRERIQYRVGNRDLNNGIDFRWVFAEDIAERGHPPEAVVVERLENGVFLGFSAADADALDARLAAYRTRWNAECEPLRERLAALGDEWQSAHNALLKARYDGDAGAIRREEEREASVKAASERMMSRFNEARKPFAAETAAFTAAGGEGVTLPLGAIVAVTRPNATG